MSHFAYVLVVVLFTVAGFVCGAVYGKKAARKIQ